MTKQTTIEARRDQINKMAQKSGIPLSGVCAFDPSLCVFETRNKQRIPENALSILCCLFPYFSPILKDGEDGNRRNISYYACVQDYHTVVTGMLHSFVEVLREAFPHYLFESFVDHSPLNEVEACRRAGLGIRGQHSLLINPLYGSYVFLGTVVTDLMLPPNEPLPEQGCIQCGLCTINCPTGAINDQGVDHKRCLSAVTQRKGILTEEEQTQIQQTGIVWGCDRCQECCPMNDHIHMTPIRSFQDNVISVISHENLPSLIKTRAFGFRGIGVMERNLKIMDEKGM